MFLIIVNGILPLKTLNHFLGNHGFSLTDSIHILYDFAVSVYYHNPTLVQAGKHFQLCLDYLGRSKEGGFLRSVIQQIIVAAQVTGNDFQLILHTGRTYLNRTFFIVIQNTVAHHHTGNHADHHDD